jgi:hypothetical protein
MLRERDHELEAARPIVSDHKALQTRCTQLERENESLLAQVSALRTEVKGERDARVRAESAAEAAKARITTADELLIKLTAVAAKSTAESSRSTSSTPSK